MLEANVVEVRRGSAHRPLPARPSTPYRRAVTRTGRSLLVIEGGGQPSAGPALHALHGTPRPTAA